MSLYSSLHGIPAFVVVLPLIPGPVARKVGEWVAALLDGSDLLDAERSLLGLW